MSDTPLTPRALAEQLVTVREDSDGFCTLALAAPECEPFRWWTANTRSVGMLRRGQCVDQLAALLDHALRLHEEGRLRREQS
jgi:hypothetical protein